MSQRRKECEITVPVYTGNLQDKKNVFVDTMGYLSIEAAHYVNSVPGKLQRQTGKNLKICRDMERRIQR